MTTELQLSSQPAASPSRSRHTLSDRVGLNFTRQLVASALGRAHLLTLVADSERNDEGRIFAGLAQYEGDPWLARVLKRHSDDETRRGTPRCSKRGSRPTEPAGPLFRPICRLCSSAGGST